MWLIHDRSPDFVITFLTLEEFMAYFGTDEDWVELQNQYDCVTFSNLKDMYAYVDFILALHHSG